MTEVNMIITSLTNSRIKEICKLKEKKYRNMTNTFLIEGINLVTEAGKRNLLKEIFVLEEKTINIDKREETGTDRFSLTDQYTVPHRERDRCSPKNESPPLQPLKSHCLNHSLP